MKRCFLKDERLGLDRGLLAHVGVECDEPTAGTVGVDVEFAETMLDKGTSGGGGVCAHKV
jgi:hypothetical protein